MNINDTYNNISLLRNALTDVGYTYEELKLNDDEYTLFKSPQNKHWLTHNSRISYPFTNASVKMVSKSKQLAYQFASLRGVPVPFTLSIDKYSTYHGEFDSLIEKYPILIVKPDNLSLSSGLTLDITTIAELKSALEYAFNYSDIALVQQQVYGDEIRFTVINGVVESALLRQTPQITGDGTSSIMDLINIENAKRGLISVPYLTYPLLSSDIISDRFVNDRKTVPSKGEIIELGKGTMIKNGASVYDVVDSIHSDYLSIVEELAVHTGTPFIVIDMFLENYAKPATKGNHWFIEFNTAPVIKMYYSCRDGKQFDALQYLTPLITKSLHI